MAYTPPTQPSLKIVKSFSYRGGTKLWSNRYFFTGDSPTDGEFSALATELKNYENDFLSSRATFVEAVGYHAGSDVPVWTGALSGTGAMVPNGSNVPAPGDCAVVVRFSTTQRSVKNHPIYLFKYYHDCYMNSSSQPNNVSDTQAIALEGAAQTLLGGISDGTDTREICGPRGAVAQQRTVLPYVRHRDFPS